MPQSRQYDRAAADYDRKFDFVAPAAPPGARRAACVRSEASPQRSLRVRSAARTSEGDFSAQDFQPRWWPAPDTRR